ncbi:MAG: ABC transporter ATP-binding protein [Eubacterium sp.]|nr:ABC transporter ATP-binding protein [Eubacterium sp.]
MSKKELLVKGLKNKDESIKLTKWMISVIKPYSRYVVYIFIISVISMVISYASTIIGKYVVDDATKGEINFKNMMFMCGTTIVSILIGIGSTILSNYINEKFSFTLRTKFFNDIQRSVWLDVSKYHSGDLVTRLTSDISTISDSLISIIPNTILIVFQLVISFCILFYYDKPIALFALIIGPIGALCMVIFKERYKKYQAELRQTESEYRSFMQENLSSLTVVKTFQKEDDNEIQMEDFRRKRLGLVYKNSKLSSIMGALMKLVYSAGYVIAFCWGSYRISTGDITYGTLTIFITLVSRVQGSISGLAGIIPQYYSMMISAKRICGVVDLKKESYIGATQMPEKVGVKVENVDFAYDREMILNNLSFEAVPGEKIAIVGPSGTGKTTIIRLLLALTHPNNGSIKYILDDKVAELASPDSRRYISYVPQGNTLLSGTIADNLRVGYKDATEEDMNRALRMASADRFVSKLPNGLDTVLSEKSGGLSEGQAQRISIARALIGNKPIIILDEATSALDEKTEASVLKSITEEMVSKTCFIITHRRSMLKYCDRVIELDEEGGITIKPISEYAVNTN